MNLTCSALFACVASTALAAAWAADKEGPPAAPAAAVRDHKLKGDYLEARTCDVWVGACFANSETSEAGRQATLVWKFEKGEWEGVDLAGTAAALIISARSTIGDPYHSALPVRNVLLVHDRSSDEQVRAIRDFVAKQTGELGGNVIEELLVPIELEVDCCDKKGCAKFTAGEIAAIETRCLHTEDKVCGHEETYYPPLVALADKHAVFTVEHKVKGTLLDLSWVDRDSRSAFLGRFEFEGPAIESRKVDPEEVRAR